METLKITNRKVARYRGTVLVETAIVIILLLMFTLGIIGFGFLFLRVQEVTNAARQGARVACVYGVKTSDYGTVATNIDTYLTSQHIDHDNTTIVTDPVVKNSVTATVKGTKLDILKLGNISFMGGAGWFPDTFTAKVTMAKEGP